MSVSVQGAIPDWLTEGHSLFRVMNAVGVAVDFIRAENSRFPHTYIVQTFCFNCPWSKRDSCIVCKQKDDTSTWTAIPWSLLLMHKKTICIFMYYLLNKICSHSKCVGLFVKRKQTADGKRILMGVVYKHFTRWMIVSVKLSNSTPTVCFVSQWNLCMTEFF